MNFFFWLGIFLIYQALILLWVNRKQTEWEHKLWRDLKKIKPLML